MQPPRGHSARHRLAAARLRTLTVHEIEQRLSDRFRLLAGGSRTALARHQTLRTTVDWSHELLSEPEQVLLRRLAVFAGGFTLGAAEEVCRGRGIEQPEIFDLLAELALKSLVVFEGESDLGRYRQLETIREYALEKLGAAGEEEDLRDLHLAWSVAFASRAEPELRGPEQPEWLDRLHAELDNFRSAFAWSVSRGHAEEALQLASALLEFWIVRADWSEGGSGWSGRSRSRARSIPSFECERCGLLASWQTCSATTRVRLVVSKRASPSRGPSGTSVASPRRSWVLPMRQSG